MFRVVFGGQTLAGFDRHAVIRAATQRMKATPEQIAKVFSGRKVVLKKGLSEEIGGRYLIELRKIGMLVMLEPDASVQASTPAHPQKEDWSRSTSLTASRIFGSNTSAADGDWAIASIHEYARMEDMRDPYGETDVNRPDYGQHFSADPIARNQPAAAAATPAASNKVQKPVPAPSAAAQQFCCPHCGKPVSLPSAATQDVASMPIRPGGAFQVSPAPATDKESSSWSDKIAAKITRILPGQSVS